MNSILQAHDLHKSIVKDLNPYVSSHSDLSVKPFEIDLIFPLPPKLRFYAYNVTSPPGGRSLDEHKIQLTLPKTGNGRLHFDLSGGRIVLLCGYHQETDVYVFWDAVLHDGFPFSKNVQVKAETILSAMADTFAIQKRTLKAPTRIETIVAVSSCNLAKGVQMAIEYSSQSLLGPS